jgi:hypothetical protein
MHQMDPQVGSILQRAQQQQQAQQHIVNLIQQTMTNPHTTTMIHMAGVQAIRTPAGPMLQIGGPDGHRIDVMLNDQAVRALQRGLSALPDNTTDLAA